MQNDTWENRLIFHEGIVLKPYVCPAGKWTIGVGRCYQTNPFTPEEKKAIGDYKNGITRNAALMLLRNDIARCVKELKENFSWFKGLDEERKYALLDMCFQLGLGGLKGFKKMLKALEQHDYKEAAKQCKDSKYHKDTPKRCERIAKLIETGVWVI